MCGNKFLRGNREYPVAMIRRVVNGFVHDLRPPQLHIFVSEADHALSVSLAVLWRLLLREPKIMLRQLNVSVFRS